MEFFEARLRGREFKVRGLQASDVPVLVSYWHDSGQDFLRSLGADPSKLPARQETARRFLASIPRPGTSQRRATFIVEDERQQPVAYANINFKSLQEGCLHFHNLKPSPLSKALAYVLFPPMIRIFFESYPLRRIVLQTSPENTNINRLLSRFGLKPQRRHLSQPDGMARPGEFNVYTIPREKAGQILRAASSSSGRGRVSGMR